VETPAQEPNRGVRDPLGSRPLVYTQAGGGISAEHERELLDRLPTTPAPDPLALKAWIESGAFPGARTLYEGIRRVPPGHGLRREGDSLTVERHWSPHYQETLAGTAAELAELLREAVFAAVARAAAGPGRSAVRLSGGLDSAAVAAGLASAGTVGTVALSALFPDHPETDERELIEATVARSGLAAARIEIHSGRAVLPAALAHIERWRLPPMSPNLFVWEPLTKRARELGVTRMLDGEGGDELFGTAPGLIADRLRRGRLAGAWDLCGLIPGMGEHPDDRALRLRALRRFGLVPLIPPAVLRRRRRRRAESAAAGSLLSVADLLALAEIAEDRRPPAGPLWWRGLVATLTGEDGFDVAGHLRREEIDTGIERRHPFLFDLELVETVLRLPPELGFDPLRDRPLLRDALGGHAAEAVLARRGKARFNPLLAEALAGPEGQRLLGPLAAADAPIRDYVEGAALERLLGTDRSALPARDAVRLWRLGLADLWLRALTGA
jgi:asparagine synthase (glutamine-hydrolysing)